VLLVLLAAIGLTVLYSAAGDQLGYVKRQLVFLLVGFVIMVVVAQFPLRFWERWTILFYGGGIVLLVLVMLVGVGAKGAQRWLDLGVIRVQPSELMKLAVPMMVGAFFHRRAVPPSFKETLIALGLILIPGGLILIQPDLGTSLLICSSGLFALFLAGLGKRYILSGIALAVVTTPLAWAYLLRDYQRQRVRTLFNPESDALGTGWNIIQSQTAIGSGGLTGKGWGNGTQSQLNFLPESHTDFIIAVLAEEFGLVGVVALLIIYLLLVARIAVIAATTPSVFGKLVAGSMALTFFVYIFVNMGMVAGILPVVGVPLPFVSYGGTALLTLLFGFGILMAIATDRDKP
jgi:rod shape determining protein RodA